MSLVTKIKEVLNKGKTKVSDVADEPTVNVVRNTLLIHLHDGQTGSWSIAPWQGENIDDPWKDFINWYITLETPAYLIGAKEGSTMIRRDMIQSFTTRLDQIKVPASQVKVAEQ